MWGNPNFTSSCSKNRDIILFIKLNSSSCKHDHVRVIGFNPTWLMTNFILEASEVGVVATLHFNIILNVFPYSNNGLCIALLMLWSSIIVYLVKNLFKSRITSFYISYVNIKEHSSIIYTKFILKKFQELVKKSVSKPIYK